MSGLSLFWLIALGVCSAGIFALPFVPVWRSARQRDANANLPMSKRDDDWLAPVHVQRQHIEHEFAAILTSAHNSGSSHGTRHNGTPFLVLGPSDHLANHLLPGTRKLDSWVLATRHLDLPGEMQCSRPLYASARATIAHDASVRTVLSAHDIVFGMRARVRRWAHAGRRLDAAEGAALYGCASADGEINLARRVRFERLLAPRIVFGRPSAPTPASTRQRQPAALPPHAQGQEQRCLIHSDWHLVADSELSAEVIVDGNVSLGRNSCLRGSLRTSGSIHMESGASVLGAIFAEGGVQLANDCAVKGPLICLGNLALGAGSLIGSAQQPTSVSARHIQVEPGAIAHGAMWARRGGEVLTGSRE